MVSRLLPQQGTLSYVDIAGYDMCHWIKHTCMKGPLGRIDS